MPRPGRPAPTTAGVRLVVSGVVVAALLTACTGGSGDTPVAATAASGPASASAAPGGTLPGSSQSGSPDPGTSVPVSPPPAPGTTATAAPVPPSGTPALTPRPPAGTAPVTAPGGPASTAPGAPTPAPTVPGPVVTPPPPPPGLTPVPSIPVTTAPPIAPTATATATSPAGRVLIAITSVTSVKTAGQGPGEIAGQPAIAVTLTVRNDTRAALDLGLVSVTASYGTAATPAVGSSGVPSRPFTGTLRAGSAGSGVYVFRVPPAQRALVDLAVDYLAGAPVVLFRGRVG